MFPARYRCKVEHAEGIGRRRPYTPTHDNVSAYAATYTKAYARAPIIRGKSVVG
jgi:hypothetical protein